MAAATSVPDAVLAPDAPHAYGTILICGGGCYGGYYLRQLARAHAAQAIRMERLVVVDRDPACRAAHLIAAIHAGDVDGIARHGWLLRRGTADEAAAPEPGYASLPVEFAADTWEAHLGRHFDGATQAGRSADAVVPSPLMPNLLVDWVAARAARHHPGVPVSRVAVSTAPDTPWQRAGVDGSHYASYATWMCPVNCIEPARCPETRGPRDWSMPIAVDRVAALAAAHGTPYDGIALFHTTHRAYGVGMFDVRDALRTDAMLERLAIRGIARVLVASVSHCHGAFGELQIGG